MADNALVEICLNIDIIHDNFRLDDVHSDLIISHQNIIFLKIHMNNEVEEKVFLNWIMALKSYKHFAKSIKIKQVKSPKTVNNVDFTNSSIAQIAYGDRFVDVNGSYIIIGLKEVTIEYLLGDVKPRVYQTMICLDKYSNDLMNSLPVHFVQNIQDNQWLPVFQKSQDHDIFFSLNSNKSLISEEENKKIISGSPSILLKHDNHDYKTILNICKVLCSAVSFFQGNEIEFIMFESINGKLLTKCYRANKFKEEILRKDLGRFNININLPNFISQLDVRLISKSFFVSELIRILNLSLEGDGTSKFMLLFSILEKLRNELFTGPKKEKFRFIDNKLANVIIRDKLYEIKNLIVEEERDLFNSSIDDKLSNIKYRPQKDQFDLLYEKFNIYPSEYNLDFSKVVSLRGKIFHGISIDPEDEELLETNSKLQTFTGNLLYKYFTQSQIEN